jgi:hypothetical protein
VIAKQFSSRILATNHLATLVRNINCKMNFGRNGFETQNLSGWHVLKSKGYQKDPIQNLSFISLIFPCVCY